MLFFFANREITNVTNLPAVHYFLIEDTKLIADTITVGSQAKGRHGVQETG